MAEKRKRDDGTEGALVKRVAATDGAGGGALVTIEQARANQLQVYRRSEVMVVLVVMLVVMLVVVMVWKWWWVDN